MNRILIGHCPDAPICCTASAAAASPAFATAAVSTVAASTRAATSTVVRTFIICLTNGCETRHFGSNVHYAISIT